MPKPLRMVPVRALSLRLPIALLFIFLAGPLVVLPQSESKSPKPVVPTVNAELGDCSALFTVVDGQRKPIYNAKISVVFRYGFLNLHKQTLEVYTNSDGQGRFEGLPAEAKKPLVFRFQIGDRQKSVSDDPGVTCSVQKTVALP